MYRDSSQNPGLYDSHTVICRSCGADYSDALSVCPYCGSMNLPAAEAEYMDRLEGIRENMEQLGSQPAADAKKHFHRTRRTVLIIACILAAIIMAHFIFSAVQDRKETEFQKQEILWQRDAFPAMEELYLAGDYDGLLSACQEAEQAGHHLYQFKYRDFCYCLEDLQQAQDSLDQYLDGSGSLEAVFYDEIQLYRFDSLPLLSEADRAVLEKLREPFLEDLHTRFLLSEEDLSRFLPVIRQNGYLPFSECEEYLKGKGLVS